MIQIWAIFEKVKFWSIFGKTILGKTSFTQENVPSVTFSLHADNQKIHSIGSREKKMKLKIFHQTEDNK